MTNNCRPEDDLSISSLAPLLLLPLALWQPTTGWPPVWRTASGRPPATSPCYPWSSCTLGLHWATGQLSSCCKVIWITYFRKISFHLLGELLPADMRSFGSGLLGILDNISLFVSVKMGPTIISSLGVVGSMNFI